MEAGSDVHSTTETDKRRTRVLVLLFAVCFIDGADVQLLPSSFRAMEANLGMTPTKLGTLSLVQALTMSIFAPFWGSLCDSGMSRKWLLTAGVTSWGFLTMVLATISSFPAMIVVRCLNGVALASLLPVTQVIIAGLSVPEERGKLFGCAEFSRLSGSVASQFFTTSISNVEFHLPNSSDEIWGWRVAFFVIGGLSLVMAFVLASFMEELGTRRTSEEDMSSFINIFGDIFRRARVYGCLPTFQLIVLQGVFGSIPWNALSFLAMFFQYVGFKDTTAAGITMAFLMAGGIGNLIGGCIGDALASWNKYHGRPLAGQITVFAGIPLISLVLVAVPASEASFVQYLILLILMGLLSSWALTGVKRPILSEIIRVEDWASILALDSAIEGSSAALFGAPIVGYLAEHAFGYKASTGQVSEMPLELRQANERALASAMLWTTAVPWTLCFLGFSLIHITYPNDLRALEAEESELVRGTGDIPTEDTPLLKGDDDGCIVVDS